jgi:hypothetical protein
MKISITTVKGKPEGKPVRSQEPSDLYGRGQANYWQPGQIPVGGFRSTFCFSDDHNPKNSPTSKPGNAKSR